MFTNNYIKYQAMLFFYQTSVKFVQSAGKETRAISAKYIPYYNFGRAMATGRCVAAESEISVAITSSEPIGDTYPGVFFGSGTTPPTKDDYDLESMITTGLAITNTGTSTKDKGNGVYSVEASYVLRNTSAATITVSEMGTFGEVHFKTNSDYHAYRILFERQVLEEPVIIQPGESKLITYKLTFNQSQ